MDLSAENAKQSNIFLKFHPLHRIMIGLILAALAYPLLRKLHHNALLQIMFLWDIFALAVLITSWIVFFTRPIAQIRQFSRREDGSLVYVFLSIVLASFSSMLALFLLFLSKETATLSHAMFLFASIPAMLLSWAMIHTTFAFHYAHIFYDDADDDKERHAGGLDFPGEKKPDYLDFAYFSFVIGMTFQVSDVQITSRKIRGLALLHGVLAFLLNTFVVAITINLIAGLKN
ncbi:MAG TPA: DUF1345 domain-containing protein [Puia sp.]|nr:DUF1345 domain-containing protein [Puia sp.]